MGQIGSETSFGKDKLQITGPTGTTVSREIMSGRTDRCKTGRQQGERCW